MGGRLEPDHHGQHGQQGELPVHRQPDGRLLRGEDPRGPADDVQGHRHRSPPRCGPSPSRPGRSTWTWRWPRTAAGAAFPGFTRTGIYAVAPLCSTCQVPAPVALSILQPSVAKRRGCVKLTSRFTALAGAAAVTLTAPSRRAPTAAITPARWARGRPGARARSPPGRRSDRRRLQPGRPGEDRRDDHPGRQPVLVQRLLVHARDDAGLGQRATRRRWRPACRSPR